MKRFLKIIGIILLIIVVVVVGYLGYVWVTYDRIEDNQVLAVEGEKSGCTVSVGEEYTIVTQNMGFGAYTRDFSFFMDGGTESRAKSPETVLNCFSKATQLIEGLTPDIILFQEVDEEAHRSCKIDQIKLLEDYFAGNNYVYARNFDSAYIMYPITKPHGKSKSGILTISKFDIASGLRRQFEISNSVSKLVDLDRCYSVSRIPVNNGHELIIYNTHMSAYGGSDVIRESQLSQICSDMKEEYEKGNYVICGGDFNCDFASDSVKILNGEDYKMDVGWAQPMLTDCIPDGIVRCLDYVNGEILPTCRNCNKPYEEGDFTIIVDGFLASENVETTYLENIQNGFEFADHMPVVMKFKLVE
ncbi:MAG: endonuclease/exonuclease/phosphatase family protein [Lachnospiraceae bacterium]|nr:endonuclease/exonuclease/phosphatase family protein [Candidatus Colinaster scatohippi]